MAIRRPVILVVDDNDDVRDVAVQALCSGSYDVLSARNGDDALSIIESTIEIDLMLTDLLMPGLDGVALARAALVRRPGLVVRYMSGAVADLFIGDAVASRLIRKPFRTVTLIADVAKALDGQSPAGAPEDGAGPDGAP